MNARLIQPNELASHQTAPAVGTHNVGISLEERSRQIAQGDLGKKLHLDQSSHPMACFFSFAIKAFGAVTYLFYSWILDGYLSAFMYTVIIYAIDFWVMKNLIGRSLMGLRWWTVNLEDGTEKWVYESKEEEYHPNKVDYYFFWGSMVVGLLFWGTFGFFNILSLRFTWAVINIICLGLIGMNFYAFLKCSKEYQAKMKTLKKALGNPTAQAGVTAMGLIPDLFLIRYFAQLEQMCKSKS